MALGSAAGRWGGALSLAFAFAGGFLAGRAGISASLTQPRPAGESASWNRAAVPASPGRALAAVSRAQSEGGVCDRACVLLLQRETSLWGHSH